jgi:hypothetical protein
MAADTAGVFISHISEESPVALVLKKYLTLAFGNELPIFVSTDKTSIETGEQWYNRIIQTLRKAKAVLVVLSQESSRRPWINFESGFGVGSDALVILISLSRFTFSQLSFPLLGIQGRSVDEIGPIIDAVAGRVGRAPLKIDVDAYVRDMKEAEAKLIYKSLLVAPVLGGNRLQFDITNIGNIDLELLMLEVLIPRELEGVEMFPGPMDGVDSCSVSRNGRAYRWVGLYSPRGVYGNVVPMLRPIITPSMGAVRPTPYLPIRRDAPSAEQHQPIFFQIHAVGYTTEMERREFADIPSS